MKKKLTMNTLAWGNLKYRKKQYTIMIIGIVLAMVFSSSMLFFMLSANETYKENFYNEQGMQDGVMFVESFEEEDYKKAVDDKAITDYSFAHHIGYAYANEDEKHLGASVSWLDDKAKEISYQKFIEGTYPVNENEIAAEKNALYKIGYDNAKIGDTIKVKLMVQNGKDYAKTVTKEYKLTGILVDKKKNVGMSYSESDKLSDLVPAFFVAQNTQTEPGGREKLVAYIVGNPDFKYVPKNFDSDQDDLDDRISRYYYFSEKSGFSDDINLDIYSGYRVGNAFLEFSSISGNTDYIVIIILVLMLASCVMIVNSFNTNLKERKKQIGMLRAVGTTRRQIIKIFGREAFIISLLATPVSIIISYAIVRILLAIISENAVMSKSIIVLPVAAVINICIVMASALIPLINASKITPMQAIRNIDVNRKFKNKKIKSKMQFNASAHIAKRNLRFYKGGTAAVSVILSLTILLSCFGFSFIFAAEENSYKIPFDYELFNVGGDSMSMSNYTNSSSVTNGLSERERVDIESMEYISTVYGKKRLDVALHLDEFTDYFKIFEGDSYGFIDGSEKSIDEIQKAYDDFDITKDEALLDNKELLQLDKDFIGIDVIAYDDDKLASLEDNLIDGKIDYEKLASGEEVILVAPQKAELKFYVYNNGSGYGSYNAYDDDIEKANRKYTTIAAAESPYKAGDMLTLTIAIQNDITTYDQEGEGIISSEIEDSVTKTVRVGAIVSPNVTDSSDNGMGIYGLGVLTDIQGINKLYPGLKYTDLYVYSDEEITDSIDKEITEELQHYCDKYSGYLNSNYQIVQSQKEDIASMFTALLAVIIICFVICASIVNNSITAQIRENKRVIGTLRAVGAAGTDLVKSYVLQMVSMFGWGIGIGFGLFLGIYGIAYLVVTFYTHGEWTLTFSPWITIGLLAVLFVTCYINVWQKVKAETKNSIIDNIREL